MKSIDSQRLYFSMLGLVLSIFVFGAHSKSMKLFSENFSKKIKNCSLKFFFDSEENFTRNKCKDNVITIKSFFINSELLTID